MPSNVLGVKRSVRRCYCQTSPVHRLSAFQALLQHLGISEEALSLHFPVPTPSGID